MHFLEHHYIVLLCSSHFLLSVWLLAIKKSELVAAMLWYNDLSPRNRRWKIYNKDTTWDNSKTSSNRRHVLNNACNGLISITNKSNFSLWCLPMAFHKAWFVLGRGPPTFLPLHNVQTLIRYLSITHLSFQEHLFSWVVRGSCIWFCDKH